MARLFDLLARMALGNMPVLLHGETGAGKEIAALALHRFSPRSDGAMVSINCAAIPDGLAESELFGHEKGSFSGATEAKDGQLEAASGGTVFLDEVGDLPLATQARLLRALDSHRIRRVGALVERSIDVRIVAATNRDLGADIQAGRFRADLYYRLNGASVTIPPLRERPRDLPLIAQEFLAAARARMGHGPAHLSDDAMARLAAHRWPGNVRELKNAMDYAAALAEADVIAAVHLPPPLVDGAPTIRAAEPPAEVPQLGPVVVELRRLERLRMEQALVQTLGHQRRAATLLGVPLRTFVTRMKLYGLRSDAYRANAKSAS